MINMIILELIAKSQTYHPVIRSIAIARENSCSIRLVILRVDLPTPVPRRNVDLGKITTAGVRTVRNIAPYTIRCSQS